LAGEGPLLVLQPHGLVEMVLAQHGPGSPQEIRLCPTPLLSRHLADQGREGVAPPFPTRHRHQQGSDPRWEGRRFHLPEQGSQSVVMGPLPQVQQQMSIGPVIEAHCPPGQGQCASQSASGRQQQGLDAAGAQPSRQSRGSQGLAAEGAWLAEQPIEGPVGQPMGRFRQRGRGASPG
jgi:hypothetical protein